MKLPKKLEGIIDLSGVVLALIVDLMYAFVCFRTLSPDLLTAIAFIAMGMMIVIFVVRSCGKGQFVPWLIFVSVVFFFDYSYTLEAMKKQSQKIEFNVFEDAEVKRLDTEIARNDTNLTELRKQYNDAAKRETLEEINGQITTENRTRESNVKAREKRISLVERKNEGESDISSDDIFNAIPNGLRDKRYTQMVIVALMFIGLQMMIVVSFDTGWFTFGKKKNAMVTGVIQNRLTAADFVRYVYYGVSIDKPYMPQEFTMGQYCKISGKPWDAEAKASYKKWYMALSKGGFIGENNSIVKTKTEADALAYLEVDNAASN
jgi:hypothetical protein